MWQVAVDNNQAVQALGALAHDTRLALYRMLVERGPDGLPAGVIAERLGLPPSSLTFHVFDREGSPISLAIEIGPDSIVVVSEEAGKHLRAVQVIEHQYVNPFSG